MGSLLHPLNSTSVVTGSNRGIGKVIVEKFVSEGLNVIACSRSTTPEFSAWCQDMASKFNVDVIPLELNLEDSNSIKNCVSAISKLGLNIDSLINNAGYASGSRFQMTPEREILKTLEINFIGPFKFTQSISRLISKSGGGSITFISSSSSLYPQEGMGVYGASKSAINYLSKVLALELASLEIRVNVVAPGVTNTDMLDMMDKGALDSIMARTRMGKPAEPSDIAAAVYFLSSSAAKHISGSTLEVTGGYA